MPVASGTKLGPYEIVASLGAGGMGEVYRARDARIGRDVALKILPAGVSNDPDRLRRFELEARATGALNHPNILAIHDVGTQDGTPYLVAELLEGETLREKVRSGALSPRKAIEYAIQIAQGLAAAHQKGIAHRDLKPENIFVTKDGRIKILDFGLAKLIHPEEPAEGASSLQTADPGSKPGVVLGTMGYMSPEQVRGQPYDHRSDIFTFGAILYEMLSGVRAFHGDTAADTISAILHKDPPDISIGTPDFPPALNRLIRHCLEKDPAHRYQSTQDVAFDLEMFSTHSGNTPSTVVSQRAPRKLLHNAVTAILVVVVIILSIAYFRRPEAIAPIIRFSFDAPVFPTTDNNSISALHLSVSPDGRQVVFTGQQKKGPLSMLWIRKLSDTVAQPVAGTETAAYPFWSPDNRFVGFFAAGKLKKVDIQTGASQVICDASAGRGGSWSTDGKILFAPDKLGGLYVVSSDGGDANPVTEDLSGQGVTFRWPLFLPDNDHFLYLEQSASGQNGNVYISSLSSRVRKLVLKKGNSNISYISPGYLLFYRDGKLMGQMLDLKTQALTGEAFAVTSDQIAYNQTRGAATFSSSNNGVLAYQADTVPPSQLLWLDRSGKQVGVVGDPGHYTSPRISPDGRRIAVVRHDLHAEEGDIWLFDVERSNMSRFTFDSNLVGTPTWTPDGKQVVFGWWNIYRKDSTGTGQEIAIFESPVGKSPTDVTPDGQFVSVNLDNAKTLQDLWIQPLVGNGKPYCLLNGPYDENSGMFSPDGRWLAYQSNESGVSEIYVRPFPRIDDGKWQISTAGGILPQWRGDGRELYYVSRDNRMMAVNINTEDKFEAGTPQPLFQMPLVTLPGDTLYDVSADGQRFIVTGPPGNMFPSTIAVIVNFQKPSTTN